MVAERLVTPGFSQEARTGDFPPSLANLVINIGIAQELVRSPGDHPLRTSLLGAFSLVTAEANPELAFASIKLDTGFRSFRDRLLANAGRQPQPEAELAATQTFLEGYARFLAGDASPAAKLLVISHRFQDYLLEQSRWHAPGPYTQRLLEGIRKGNMPILECVAGHLEVFFIFNEIHFWFPDRMVQDQQLMETAVEAAAQTGDDQVEEVLTGVLERNHDYTRSVVQACAKFKEHANTLLDLVFNEEDQSPWRQFCLSNLTAAALPIIRMFLPNDYDPETGIGRTRQLCQAVPSDKWPFLADYLMHVNGEAQTTLDQEILNGQTRRAEVYTNYLNQIRSNNVPSSLQNAIGAWGERFVEGKASEEELGTAAGHIIAVGVALNSLPARLRSEIEIQHGDYHKADKVGVLLMDNSCFSEMSTIVELISSGVPPQDRFLKRLRKKPQRLAEITGFGKALFPLSEAGLSVVPFSEDWIMLSLQGYLQENSLPTVAEYILAIYRKGFSTLQSLDPNNNGYILFYHLCSNREMYRYGQAAADLLVQGIFPTPLLTSFVQENQGGLAELLELREATAAGNFDPQNLLQKELEWTKYLQINPIGKSAALVFPNLDFINPETGGLTHAEQLEAEVAAYEAAKFYWFVAQRVEAGRKVVVIGNERYGWNFVVEPLRGHLENIGVGVGRYRISSGTPDTDTSGLLEKLGEFIAREHPDDIIIVDGTADLSDNGKARFPRAMVGWINVFDEVNQSLARPFHTSHWLPQPTEQVIIGNKDHQMTFQQPLLDEGECLILANPVHQQYSRQLPFEFRHHQPAYFDDPDSVAASRIKIVLTSHGLQRLHSDKTEATLVAAVQRHMGLILDEMIEKTKP